MIDVSWRERDPVRRGLYETVPADTMRLLEARGRHAELRSGTRLMTIGDRSDDVYLVRSGYVKVLVDGPDGEVALVAVRGRGDLLGEFGASTGRLRTASVIAAGPVEAVVLAASEYREFLRQRPEVHAAVDAAVIDKMGLSTRRRLEYARGTGAVRLARAIRDMALDFGRLENGVVVIPVPLSQADWAAIVGVTERRLSTLLTRLVEAKAVRTRTNSVMVLDFPLLERTAKSRPA
ncbi:Crp/Fnr family transcriptional regulator [Cryptosporangium phraense]|uniref:Crp/Fnr family transcriptional regulator n=1 Tax=Cryptosporangium phraense TaxID=2593070 RepID=A0A545AH03_9ACTN|nr:Crp/Fnr family transcriptional regulator [Cryptosporangium phraense]TQS40602.1 Crp/Fnr family transcriptional regulator [Cryptosporangium phraense]